MNYIFMKITISQNKGGEKSDSFKCLKNAKLFNVWLYRRQLDS